jgi:AbrB family looped-hinge helix DNA binding protein
MEDPNHPRPPEGKFMSSVKVGPKGQIVIPKEARDMFNIQPGDILILLADVERGIAIQRQEFFNQIADAIFSGKMKSPDAAENDALERFAEEYRNIEGPPQEEE